jgi:hypothetical protein
MKRSAVLLGFLFAVSLAAIAQVEPAANGPARRTGTFNYSLHDTESTWWSGGLGNSQSNTASGNLSYINGKSHRPFTLNYSGGYSWTFSGSSYGSGYFQNLGLSQGFMGRKWRLTVSDNLSYRPQAPTFGFSGVPGTGEPITGSGSTGSPTETVLTEDTHTINNGTRVSFGMPLSFAVGFFADADYDILRYPDADGLNTDSFLFGTGVSRRVTARTSVTGAFQESRFTYPGTTTAFKTTAVLGTVTHGFKKRLTGHVTAGPEWISTSGITTFPSSINYSISAGLTYSRRLDDMSVNYYHGDNGGSGIFYGAEFNSLSATYGRKIEKSYSVAVRFGYQETAGLQTGSGSASGYFAGASTSRRLGKLFSAGVTYTATQQTTSSQLPGNALNTLLQGVSVSIGYAPRGMKLEP